MVAVYKRHISTVVTSVVEVAGAVLCPTGPTLDVAPSSQQTLTSVPATGTTAVISFISSELSRGP